MKKTKKLLAMLVAMAMMFSLSITSLAAPGIDEACGACVDVCPGCGGVASCDAVDGSSDPDPCDWSIANECLDGDCCACDICGVCDGYIGTKCTQSDCALTTGDDACDCALPVESDDKTGEIKGDGDTTYVDTKIYSVVLPTSAAWDFILDPQGLIGAYRANNETADPLTNVGLANSLPTDGVTAAALVPYAGRIIPGTTVPVFQNRSSYNVALGVSIRVTGDATIVATTGEVAPTATPPVDPENPTALELAAIAAETANNVLLNVQLQENTVNTNVLAATPAFAAATAPVEVALDNPGKTLSFILAGANYVFTGDPTDGFDYERVTDSYGNGTALQLGGLVNRNANWEDFADGADKIGVEVKFSLAETATAVPTTGTAEFAYGFAGAAAAAEGVFAPAVALSATATLASNGLTVSITPTNFTFPNGTRTTYTIDAMSQDSTPAAPFTEAQITAMELTGGVLSFNVPNAWGPSGARGGFVEMTITWAGGPTITLTKANGQLATPITVVVTPA
jgi:hypothetical protein